jgi:hypothetical protein
LEGDGFSSVLEDADDDVNELDEDDEEDEDDEDEDELDEDDKEDVVAPGHVGVNCWDPCILNFLTLGGDRECAVFCLDDYWLTIFGSNSMKF